MVTLHNIRHRPYTKIICTLGPATDQGEVLRDLLLNGMNVARLNFSHGSHKDHLARVQRFKALRDETGMPAALLCDMHVTEQGGRHACFVSQRLEPLNAGEMILVATVRKIQSRHVHAVEEEIPEYLSLIRCRAECADDFGVGSMPDVMQCYHPIAIFFLSAVCRPLSSSLS